MTALAVAVGGALGALARYTATGWVRAAAGTAFPWGTLAVNTVGSFLLGLAMVWLPSRLGDTDFRPFLTVGLLGSFTTFSTFSYEAVELAQSGEWWRAGAYTGGSVAIGVLAVLLGAAAGMILESGTR